MEQRICRKCLLKELGNDEYFSTIYEYIKNIPVEQRSDDALYAERIRKCKECESLINGMCSQCGCFVEVRAAKKLQHCAKSDKIW